MRDERAIDHVPKFLVVLKFLIDHFIQYGTAFPYGVASKFRKNVWNRYVVLVTNPLDVFHDLLDHVFIIILESERGLDGESTADIDRIQRWTNLLQFAILENEAAELTPIV